MTRLTLGGFEPISIPALGVEGIVAKVDTGAFSGALHCTNISLEDDGGSGILRFMPLGRPELATSTTDFQSILVRSANGHEQERYIIPIVIVVQGKECQTVLGISDRTNMKRDMLLGRRFLIEQEALVDVLLTKDSDAEAGEYGL